MSRDDTSRGEDREQFEDFGLGAYDYLLPEPTWIEPTHRRAIMASLVKGVYWMEEDRRANLWEYKQINNKPEADGYDGGEPGGRWWSCRRAEDLETMKTKTLVWWETFHYEMVRPMMDEEGKRLIGAVYRTLLHHNRDRPMAGAPRVVVAFRGTMRSGRDFLADLYIVLHLLSTHKRYHIGLEAVRKELCKPEPDVAIAGHSKGSALGLLIGSKLAEEGTFLEVHLFNPPHPTLASDSGHVGQKISKVLSSMHNVVANGISHMLEDDSARQKESESFCKIALWLPNLYINREDMVSRAYIGYFEANNRLPQLRKGWFRDLFSDMPRSIISILSQRFLLGSDPDGCPDHFIPSANLYVVTPDPHDLRNNPLSIYKYCRANHGLNQWLLLEVRPSVLNFQFDCSNIRANNASKMALVRK